MSRKRMLWGVVFFAVFLIGAEMCATMSRTGADISVWAMATVVTIAGATGAGWLVGMPARESSLHQPMLTPTPTPTIVDELGDDWSRFEDGWVEA